MDGMFEGLKLEEVEARVSTVKENGMNLVLFISARTVMEKLDRAVGPMNWKRELRIVDGKTYCSISIRDRETGEWVPKEDVGTASQSAAEKGEVSDAFKRAAVSWGIGRELYSAPPIWVRMADCRSKYDSFKVTAYECSGGRITCLRIMDQATGKEVFSYGRKAAKPGSGDGAPGAAAPAAESLAERARKLIAREHLDEKAVRKACEEAGGTKYGIRPGMELDEYPESYLEKVVIGKLAGIRRYLEKDGQVAKTA